MKIYAEISEGRVFRPILQLAMRWLCLCCLLKSSNVIEYSLWKIHFLTFDVKTSTSRHLTYYNWAAKKAMVPFRYAVKITILGGLSKSCLWWASDICYLDFPNKLIHQTCTEVLSLLLTMRWLHGSLIALLFLSRSHVYVRLSILFFMLTSRGRLWHRKLWHIENGY